MRQHKEKRLLRFITVIAVLLLMAACNSSTPEPAAPAEEPAAEEPAAVQEAAPEEEAEAPAEEEAMAEPEGEPIQIGGSLALTGFLAPTAAIHKIVGDEYIKKINAEGGLLGRPVEWVLFDDEAAPDKAAALYERLITEEEVDLLIGPYGTGTITAGMNVAERYGYVFPHHTASLTYAYTYDKHFPLWYTGLHPNITTSNLLFDSLDTLENPPETMAFVVNQFPGSKFMAYGQEGTDEGGAVQVAEERGYDVVLDVDFPTNINDWGPIAAQVRDADPDFIYLAGLGLNANGLIEALNAIDYQPRGFFVLWPAAGPLLALGDAAEGVMSVTLFEEHEPFLSNLGAEEMVEKFGAAAEEAGMGYSAVETQASVSWATWQVLQAAVEATGSLDQDVLADWLHNNTIETVLGPVRFDANNQNYGPDLQKIKQVQNGDWPVVYPEEYAKDGATVQYPMTGETMGAMEEEAMAEPEGEPIQIGGSLALTGFLAPTAAIHKIVGDEYIEKINSEGGLLGRPVEWVLFDDEAAPDKAAALYERLITEEEVDLLIGPYGTGTITAGMNVAERYGYVFPHHTASLTYAYTYDKHFPLWYTGLHPNITTSNLLFDALDTLENPPETMAFVVNQFPGSKFMAYGQEGTDEGGAVKVAEERGYDVVLDVDFPTNINDWGPIAAQVRDADPDFIYLAGLGLNANGLIEALNAIDYQPRGFFVLWPAAGPLLALGDAAEGVMSVTLFEEHEPFLSYPGAEEMVEKFGAAAEEAGMGYTAVETQASVSWATWQVLQAAVEATGSLDQDVLADWLHNNTIETVLGPVSFDANNQNYGPDLQKIKQVQNGDWPVVYPEEFAKDGATVQYPSSN